MSKLVTIAGFLLVFSLAFRFVYAVNFLQNPGFEEETNGWTPSNSKIILSAVSDPSPRSGNKALKIENKSNTTSAIGAEQEVADITPGGQYLVSGFAMFTDPNVNEVKIRVAWYKEGATSQFSTTDTDSVNSPTSSWIELSKIIKAPEEAVKAEIRLVVSKKTTNPATAYFDDIFFQPDYTPTPTATPIPTATLNPTSTPSQKSTSVGVGKTQQTQPTGQALGVSSQTDSKSTPQFGLSPADDSSNLNLSASNTPLVFQFATSPSTTEPAGMSSAGKAKNSKIFAVLIIAGIFLVSLVSFYSYWQRRKARID